MKNLNKTKARSSLLEMAKGWEKKGKIQHAIEACEAIIEADAESDEAVQATDFLLEIAKRYEREGKRHSAYQLYHKVAEGRAGAHNHK